MNATLPIRTKRKRSASPENEDEGSVTATAQPPPKRPKMSKNQEKKGRKLLELAEKVQKIWQLDAAEDILPEVLVPRERKPDGSQVTLEDDDKPLLPASQWGGALLKALLALARYSDDRQYCLDMILGWAEKRHQGYPTDAKPHQQSIREAIPPDVRMALKRVKYWRPGHSIWAV